MSKLENETSLSQYYLHFAKGNKRENGMSIRRFKNKNKTELNNNYDKLFFNFLLIVRIELLTPDYNKNTELKFKYDFAHKMENMKFKTKENVINNLCYDDNINLKTLSALCVLFSKTMIYSCNNIFAMLNQCDGAPLSYLVKKDLSITCVKEDTLKALKGSGFEIQNIDKPFYSIAYYKVNDLKTICAQIGLNVDGTKKVFYEKMVQHVSNAIF